ncbi:MAG TPA: hypothetical protein VIL86_05435 [Tepidisphaeraceae bacterium]|jgi:hypothetical protein
MNAGDTFLFPGGADDHLWMIISDPAVDPQKVVILKFVSWQERYEQTCIVRAGEHPFVKHDTCVSFSSARITEDANLQSLQSTGRLVMKQPLSAALLGRIRAAVMDSDGIPAECVTALVDQGVVLW